MAVAIFDLDNTLLEGTCSSLWAAYLADLAWVDRDSFLQRDGELLARYEQGELSMADYLSFSLSALVGRTAEEVDFVLEPFVEDVIEPLLHNDAMRRIADHRSAGDRVLLAAAIPTFLIAAIADRLGLADVLGIDLQEQHGFYSGNTEGVPTYGEGKLQRVLAWLAEQGLSLADASLYTHSPQDLPLLERVDRPHAVNPGAALLEQAERAGWPVLTWR